MASTTRNYKSEMKVGKKIIVINPDKAVIGEPSFNCGGKDMSYKALVKRAKALKESRDEKLKNS